MFCSLLFEVFCFRVTFYVFIRVHLRRSSIHEIKCVVLLALMVLLACSCSRPLSLSLSGHYSTILKECGVDVVGWLLSSVVNLVGVHIAFL